MKHYFYPRYISLAPTYRCILNCPHCTVPQWDHVELSIQSVGNFLQECFQHGIKEIGITGGEPFLAHRFLTQISETASRIGFSFDKIMTSAVWSKDAATVRKYLTPLIKAGYDGKFCISVDDYHSVPPDRVVNFVMEAVEITGRGDICSLAYTSSSPGKGIRAIMEIGRLLGLKRTGSLRMGTAHLISPDLCLRLIYNHLSPLEKAAKLASGWDGKWFREDWCAGPGQALYVNPKGEVKPCCGYANDLDAMTIGRIDQHSVEELVRRVRKHPFVGFLYRRGLTAIRDEILSWNPCAFPGKTSDHCFFCWYVQVHQLWPIVRK